MPPEEGYASFFVELAQHLKRCMSQLLGEKVFQEAIEMANKKQVGLSEVFIHFSKANKEKRERLARWLDPLALLPEQKKKQEQQKSRQR